MTIREYEQHNVLLLAGECFLTRLCSWEQVLSFGAKCIPILQVTVQILLIFQNYPKLVHVAPLFTFEKIRGFRVEKGHVKNPQKNFFFGNLYFSTHVRIDFQWYRVKIALVVSIIILYISFKLTFTFIIFVHFDFRWRFDCRSSGLIFWLQIVRFKLLLPFTY